MRALAGLLICLSSSAAVHWSITDREAFLRDARVGPIERTGEGSTGSFKAQLDDGRRRHYAHIQHIDIYQSLWKGKDGSREQDFKDSWKFNVAAYRLAKLLGLTGMVPVSVERVVHDKPASVTWWVDDVLMDEKKRYSENIAAPDAEAWRRQMDTIRVFDQLIYNMDRNRENLLITRDWKVWMIDHTRAFRKHATLRNPAAITVCDKRLLESLKRLKRDAVMRELGAYLTPAETDGLMARRDIIVDLLEQHMSAKR